MEKAQKPLAIKEDISWGHTKHFCWGKIIYPGRIYLSSWDINLSWV